MAPCCSTPRPVSLGRGCYAWVQPDGGWGLSNAGLITGRGEALLVDTLFDLSLTARMLDGFAPFAADAPITTLVNTHGNGDHWFGNQLLPEVEIIASAPAAGEMRAVGPEEVRALLADPGPAGAVGRRLFGTFSFDEVEPVYPNITFAGERTLRVGGVDVRLIDLGPAHSAGDTVVHVPSADTVYTGDLVFADGTPIVWHGPLANWLRACDRLVELGAVTIVPGHGPVTSLDAVREQAAYLRFVGEEAALRHAKGMSVVEAARDIDLGEYAALPERERLIVNVHAVYRELDPAIPALDGPAAFACLGELLEDLL